MQCLLEDNRTADSYERLTKKGELLRAFLRIKRSLTNKKNKYGKNAEFCTVEQIKL